MKKKITFGINLSSHKKAELKKERLKKEFGLETKPVPLPEYNKEENKFEVKFKNKHDPGGDTINNEHSDI